LRTVAIAPRRSASSRVMKRPIEIPFTLVSAPFRNTIDIGQRTVSKHHLHWSAHRFETILILVSAPFPNTIDIGQRTVSKHQ